jgi:hypothetical protein
MKQLRMFVMVTKNLLKYFPFFVFEKGKVSALFPKAILILPKHPDKKAKYVLLPPHKA